MADDDIHHTIGDHGARIKGLEKGRDDTNRRVKEIADQREKDVRKGLLWIIGLFGAMFLKVFDWAGEKLSQLVH